MDLDASSREIVRLAFADSGLRESDLVGRIAEYYRGLRLEAIQLYPGATETLQEVRRRGIRTALLTNGNGEAQRRSVERFDLARHFDCVVIEGEFGVGKPDVRVFEHAMAACGVSPAEVWMVGDSLEADIAPAVALGMHAVWIAGAPDVAPPDGVRPHRVIADVGMLLG
jgi:putative hydrolase of the HAD superfamily